MQYSCTHVYRAAGSERSASGREITWERYSDACGRRAAQCALQQHGGLHVAAGELASAPKFCPQVVAVAPPIIKRSATSGYLTQRVSAWRLRSLLRATVGTC